MYFVKDEYVNVEESKLGRVLDSLELVRKILVTFCDVCGRMNENSVNFHSSTQSTSQYNRDVHELDKVISL